MNEKFGSLGAHEFFLGNHFEGFKFLALSYDCNDCPFLTSEGTVSNDGTSWLDGS